MSKLPRILPPSRAARSAAVALALAAGLAGVPSPAAAQSAESLYSRALARERQVRDAGRRVTVADMRRAVGAYETVVRRYPRSGYCDNALWQAGNLALLAYERFGQARDRQAAIRLLTHLRDGYPSSAYVARARDAVGELDNPRAAAAPPPPSVPPARSDAAAAAAADSSSGAAQPAAAPSGVVTITDIKRTSIPDGVRVSIEMDGEVLYRAERLENPHRVFFDLKGARPTLSLQDATIRVGDDIIREIRLGRHPQNTTRVVMHLEGQQPYTVFTLYNPFRLVVDFRTAAAEAAAAAPLAGAPAAKTGSTESAGAPVEPKVVPAAREPVPLVTRRPPAELLSPTVPAANANGQFSIARQLGLGISRIVLDAGHGGHDPGARSNGLTEAELVLDVTLRLRALLEKEPGIEVTLTRDRDVFIPLEERTAIANRTDADLFLSIHANASRNTRARGVETYFLNFASNPEAEAVAARENSASARKMRSLPDIVRAIALNNKIDESRDFAEMVQASMVRRLSARNATVRDLGVKQAPFVVLIGAGMPSVLAEISFVTNRQEGSLLKTPAYRQQIAEALKDAIVRYQRSLKGLRTVAALE